MSELPSEKLGYTDITLCIINCEVTTSVSQLGPSFGRNSKISVSDREAHIKALACHIQDRYLDHFDLGVPIQWMVQQSVTNLESSTETNDVGIPYILMSKATGFPLQRVWKSTKSGQTEISAEIKSKVLFQLGSIAFKLSQLRFDCIGSLFEHDGIVQVGECFSRGHILHERYSLEDVPRGPFTSETQFYSLIEALIQHAETFTTIASLFCRTCSSPGAI